MTAPLGSTEGIARKHREDGRDQDRQSHQDDSRLGVEHESNRDDDHAEGDEPDEEPVEDRHAPLRNIGHGNDPFNVDRGEVLSDQEREDPEKQQDPGPRRAEENRILAHPSVGTPVLAHTGGSVPASRSATRACTTAN